MTNIKPKVKSAYRRPRQRWNNINVDLEGMWSKILDLRQRKHGNKPTASTKSGGYD